MLFYELNKNNIDKFKKILSNNLSVIILFLLGLLLRRYYLSSKSLWYDEIFVLHESQKTFVALFHVDSEGVHPPLYRLIMHFWLYLVHSEKLVRIPSLIFSSVSIIVGYKTAELIFSKRIALYTAFFITVSPFHIYYAQEVKGYSLLFLLSLLSAYFFLKGIQENKLGLWSGYVSFTTFSIYTHYFGFLNILAQNLFIIFSRKKYERDLFKKWMVAQSLIFLLFSPWLFACIQHLRRVVDNFWISKVSLRDIFIVFKNFAMGYYTSNLNFLFLQFSLAIIFLCGIWSIVFFKPANKDNLGWKSKETSLIFLSYLFIPIVIILVFSKIIRPLYLDRTLIIISFFYYIVLSKGIEAVRKNRVIFFLLTSSMVILAAISLKNYYCGNNFSPSAGIVSKEKQFREAIKYISLNYHEGDIVMLSHYSSWPIIEYYCPDSIKNQLYLESSFGSKDKNDEYSAIGFKQSFSFKTIDIEKLNKKENEGMWIVCSHWENFSFVSKQLKGWIDRHVGDLIFKSNRFKGIKLYYFK